MSDFVAAMLVLLALATVGNFAAGEPSFKMSCAGSFMQLCW